MPSVINDWIKVHNKSEVSHINGKDVPVVEAYVGEYAGGKSENAVNRALSLLERGRQVTLVDLDLVEPFYTLRPLKQKLEKTGLEVLTWQTDETIGLGEAGYPLRPDIRWALRRQHDIIIDSGYGVEGAKTLNLLEGASQHPYLQVLAVINISRPVTGTVENIIAYVQSLGRVTGLINNTHLGDETTVAVVQEGAKVVTGAAKKLGLPVVATSAVEDIGVRLGTADCMGNPVRKIKRYMPEAFW